MADPKEFPSDKADKFVVRFPDGMRNRIRAAAEENGRSMNAEIVSRLERSFEIEATGKNYTAEDIDLMAEKISSGFVMKFLELSDKEVFNSKILSSLQDIHDSLTGLGFKLPPRDPKDGPSEDGKSEGGPKK